MNAATRFLFLATIATGLPASVRGAITYVDATPNTTGSDGNTTLNGDLITTINTFFSTGSNGTDGKWTYRSLSGTSTVNGPAVWETDTTSTAYESTPALVTTLGGLTPGAQYKLYAVFWTGDAATAAVTPRQNWDIAARVGNSGGYTAFLQRQEPAPNQLGPFTLGGVATATTADGSEFTNTSPSVVTRANTVALAYASLGSWIIDASGSISIYIDGPDLNSDNFSKRTHFEGIGYELIPPQGVPGDFDTDGDVDGADFVRWQMHFPTTANATLAEGDADGDEDVDGADFVVWQTHFPYTPSLGVAAVPEPNAIAICGTGVIALLIMHRRRGSNFLVGRD
jgi:hypothetical protein